MDPQIEPVPSNEPIPELVEFFKALADPTRLRIVGLLAESEQCGQELAATLGLSPGTVTHHLQALKRAGLLMEERRSPYTYYSLDLKRMQHVLKNTLKRERVQELAAGPDLPSEERRVLNAFFDGDTLRSIPAQRRKKEIVFEEILRRLPEKETFTEPELNEELRRFHPDFCTVRREFIMCRYMTRAAGVYQWTPKGYGVRRTATA